MDVAFRPLTEADARAIVGWRYDGPYAVYNVEPGAAEAAVATLLDLANAYFAAVEPGGALVGYCCFGPDARVPGGDYDGIDALDVGLGLRPDLTGGGRGFAFFCAALAFGRARFAPVRFRLTVAAFNLRAQLVYARAGFRVVARFRRAGDPAAPEFLIMIEGDKSSAPEPDQP
jgi:[ribosomal protein S18]-alanine N-acetyltransferase